MRYSDLLRIGKFAKEFPGAGSPDDVFNGTEFGTFIEFHVAWKEESEYDERYMELWQELNKA